MKRHPVLTLFLMILLSCGPTLAQTRPAHDRAFWRQIAQSNYRVPAGESAVALVLELNTLLGSPDPELRDELAYSILYSWVQDPAVLPNSDLISLLNTWQGNLHQGLGEVGTNAVLQRSFSALCLALLTDRDLKHPFLTDSQFHGLVDAGILYLNAERDLRGYDGQLGWIHATAHTADLLASVAANARFTREEQAHLLAALAQRLQTAAQVYTQGEQGRLALAVLAVMQRPDFDAASFDTWLTRLEEADRQVWTAKPLTPENLAHFQNRTYMLEALISRMSVEKLSDRLPKTRDRLFEILRQR